MEFPPHPALLVLLTHHKTPVQKLQGQDSLTYQVLQYHHLTISEILFSKELLQQEAPYHSL